jgi:CheY-like chemotaxis protein
MPGMNGAELAKAARERFADLPILFVTGFAESDQIEGAVGPDVPVLRKPFGIEQLSAAVAEQLAVASGP